MLVLQLGVKGSRLCKNFIWQCYFCQQSKHLYPHVPLWDHQQHFRVCAVAYVRQHPMSGEMVRLSHFCDVAVEIGMHVLRLEHHNAQLRKRRLDDQVGLKFGFGQHYCSDGDFGILKYFGVLHLGFLLLLETNSFLLERVGLDLRSGWPADKYLLRCRGNRASEHDRLCGNVVQMTQNAVWVLRVWNSLV